MNITNLLPLLYISNSENPSDRVRAIKSNPLAWIKNSGSKLLTSLAVVGMSLVMPFSLEAKQTQHSYPNYRTTTTSLANYVQPRVGTAPAQTGTAGMFGKKTEEYGQTLPAVLVPHGMNFWTPQTRDTELKCIAPYYYNDALLQGFRNSHWIVGGCTQDYGSMTLMPQSGDLRCLPEDRATEFSHDNEISTPSYYSVYLDKEQILCEMTGTSTSAIFRFTFEGDGPKRLIINPNSDEGMGFIAYDSINNIVYGYNPVHRIYQGKGEEAGFSGYFIVEPQLRPSSFGTYHSQNTFPGQAMISDMPKIGMYLNFDLPSEETLLVKAASSFTSVDAAKDNLAAEIPGWNFQKVRENLEDIWEKHLGRITITDALALTSDRANGNANQNVNANGSSNAKRNAKANAHASVDEDALSKFYTALYHASFLPHAINDVLGTYPAFASKDKIVTLQEGQKGYYDDFSMWDTYRALHPLLTLLWPEVSADMMQSLVNKYQQGGWMPIFPCWNSYTAAMIGDHCIAAIADAYTKGVTNFDIEKAYEGMLQNAMVSPSEQEYVDGKGRRALKSYMEYGFIPVEDDVLDAYHKREQVSRTLEYSFDDYALSRVASLLGDTVNAKDLLQRSLSYRNVINPKTGYADARHSDGTFVGTDPVGFSAHITEGAPCHYTWYAPHDPYGLMEAMGGKDQYILRLDSMFSQNRYWHGNEPCHQVAYMFNYAGQPYKSAKAVRHVMDTEYLNIPGGLSGNDDAGQMSAWYIFSALGFYPVCPASDYYLIGSPTFEEVTLTFDNGKKLTIKAKGASKKNIYVQSAKLNGVPFTKNYISHQDLLSGGVLEFVMGPQPSRTWGTSDKDCPVDLINMK